MNTLPSDSLHTVLFPSIKGKKFELQTLKVFTNAEDAVDTCTWEKLSRYVEEML